MAKSGRTKFLPLLGAVLLAVLVALALNASIGRSCDESIECANAHLDASNAHLDAALKHAAAARRIVERLEAERAAKAMPLPARRRNEA